MAEKQVEAASQTEFFQIHGQNGELDPQLLLKANLLATYGSTEPDLRSLVMRGTLALGNGEQATFSLMRRADGKIREVAETAQIRFEYTSDGEMVRWIRSRYSQGSASNAEPVSRSPWYQARMAVGMPLGNSYDDGLKVSAKRDAEGEYYLSWENAGMHQELWLDAQTFLITKSRLIRDELKYDLEFGDYREIGGMKLPHVIDVAYSDGRFPETITVEQYQLNSGLFPSLFTP
ncbi:hypothetical protein [Cerasicoccus maritimus]|uniref:hypothetical protein n=1 Tax=Cerasicoccus maritimus TaxID=490089 RepID=UPI002852C5BE|nr:hypothetical protein [Cerasicoccus maritimus]